MRTALIILSMVYYFNGIAQVPQAGWPQEQLKGNVKKIRYSECTSTNFSELQLKSFDATNFRVDSFDRSGRKLVIYEVKHGMINVILRFSYEFDNRDNIIKACYCDVKYGELHCLNYQYDTAGDIIFLNVEDTKGRIKYTYLSRRLVKAEDSSSEGVHLKTRYLYKKGKLVEDTTYSSRGLIIQRYNNKGRVDNVLQILDSGRKRIEDKLTYDKHGNYTKNYDYVDDKNGNWIRRIETIPADYPHSPGDKPVDTYKLTVREIEYY